MGSSFNLVLIFFIYLFLCFSNLLITTMQFTTAQSIYRYHTCLGANTSTTPGSRFQTNLNLLIPSLSSSVNNSVIKTNGFYNTSVGQTPDTAYGSVQCRGDVSLDDCKTCVQMGTQDINTNERCPHYKQAIIWYNGCMLRYSNQYYFNIMEDKPTIYFLNPNNVSTNPDKFNQILDDLLKNLVTEALPNSNFATGDKNLTNSTTKVYGFVQCSADISSGDCNQCLLGAIAELPDCCYGKRAGKVLTPSCLLKYDLDPFFQSTTSTSQPPPLHASPPPSTNSAKPKSNGNSKLAVSMAVLSAIAVLSATAIWFLLRKKAKTKKFDCKYLTLKYDTVIYLSQIQSCYSFRLNLLLFSC
ncbi:hypothetical protein MKX01_010571 [Papaver californicum]|nr:hypothetical protein MKX01_010571 [Papaver californicum]